MRPETKAAALRGAAERGTLRLPTAGTSMGRVIAAGSRVAVVPRRHPRWGEVWAFCLPDDRLVIHRCRGRRGDAWLFQGDRSSTPDPLVTADQLVGRVISVHRHDGRDVRLGFFDRWVRATIALGVRLRHR